MLDRKDADCVDSLWVFEDEVWDTDRIYASAMARINGETSQKRTRRKKSLVVLLAAVIAVMGTISFGAERDWDIQFAEFIGAEAVMADLPGGYKEIGESQTVGDVTLTVSKSIGNQNSQWIQIDTNLPYIEKEETWEIFEDIDVKFFSEVKAFGYMILPFDQNGQLAFLVEILDAEGINRAEMELTAELKDGRCFSLQWKNYYAENQRTMHPMKLITASNNAGSFNVLLYEVRVSPVSVKVKGWTLPDFSERRENQYEPAIHIESVTLNTGEVVDIAEANLNTISGYSSIGKLDAYVPLTSVDPEARSIHGSDIISVTISGEEIKL